MAVSRDWGLLFGGPYTKSPAMWGLYWAPEFWKLPRVVSGLRLPAQNRKVSSVAAVTEISCAGAFQCGGSCPHFMLLDKSLLRSSKPSSHTLRQALPQTLAKIVPNPGATTPLRRPCTLDLGRPSQARLNLGASIPPQHGLQDRAVVLIASISHPS